MDCPCFMYPFLLSLLLSRYWHHYVFPTRIIDSGILKYVRCITTNYMITIHIYKAIRTGIGICERSIYRSCAGICIGSGKSDGFLFRRLVFFDGLGGVSSQRPCRLPCCVFSCISPPKDQVFDVVLAIPLPSYRVDDVSFLPRWRSLRTETHDLTIRMRPRFGQSRLC